MRPKTLIKTLSFIGMVSMMTLWAPTDVMASGSCIQMPVSCRISSNFGNRVHPVKKVNKLHRGTDFACPVGTPVKAATSGSVAYSGWDNGGGNTVKIRSGSIETKYMHNQKNIARIGDSVSAGQEVSKSGNTGAWTTGPHLHFEVWVNGSPKDPMAADCSGGETPADPPGGGEEHAGGESGGSAPQYAWEVRDGLDGSLWDMLGGIISSRALNPDYARQIGTVDAPRLYEELNYLRGIRSRVTFERTQAMQRIARNQSLINAMKGEQRHAPGLNAQRAAAIQSAANK